jgi:hypothetical protein
MNDTDIQQLLLMVGEVNGNVKGIMRRLDHMERDYITRAEFDPVKKMVFGTVALILVAVVTAIVKLAILPSTP